MNRPSRFVLAFVGLFLLACALVGPALAQSGTTLKLATVAPDGTPWSDGLRQLKTMVEKDTAGRVVVKPFVGGVLGDENETVVACQRGQIQGVGASTGAIASVVPELNVLELPYLFKSEAEADYILDTVVLATLEAAFTSKGLVLGFWSENGYRSFGTKFGAITGTAALAGKKMRAQESKVHLEMYKAFGASPVSIPVTEVLTSLQTGVVDGYDNTPLFAMAAQWTSATSHYTLTNHIYQPAAIVYNKAWFDTLSPEDQKVLLSARTGLAVQMRKEIRAMAPLLVQNMRDMGIQVHEPTAAEITNLEAAAKTARDKYLASASAAEKALYGKITAGLATYRKSH